MQPWPNRFVSGLSNYFVNLVNAGNEKGDDKDGGEPSQAQRIGAKVRNKYKNTNLCSRYLVVLE